MMLKIQNLGLIGPPSCYNYLLDIPTNLLLTHLDVWLPWLCKSIKLHDTSSTLKNKTWGKLNLLFQAIQGHSNGSRINCHLFYLKGELCFFCVNIVFMTYYFELLYFSSYHIIHIHSALTCNLEKFNLKNEIILFIAESLSLSQQLDITMIRQL